MIRAYLRSLYALLLLIGSFVLCAGAHAQTNTLNLTLSFASLPSTITLCRDPAAYQALGFDEEWEVFIDVDPSVNNGAPGGANVVLVVETTPQNPPCSPNQASLQSSLFGEIFVWNSSQQQYVDSGVSLNAVANPSAGTILIFNIAVTGALANLTSQASISAVSAGSYTPTGASPTAASDFIGPIVSNSSATGPANNVQSCTAPCSTSASWYPLIDLVGLSAVTAQPLPTPESPPAFGATTLDVEFDLVSLPTMVSLCNSSIFRTNPGYDLMWIAFANYDAAIGAYETMIAAHTPLQPGCSTPSSAALASSVQATVFRLDPNNIQNGYVSVESLPVTVNSVSGKIVVQANSTDSNLAGIASGTLREFTVEDAISSNNGDFSSIQLIVGLEGAYPQDNATQFNFGASFTEPAGDVCTTSSSCTSASYPIIDLTGGSAHMDDWIFRNGFEP